MRQRIAAVAAAWVFAGAAALGAGNDCGCSCDGCQTGCGQPGCQVCTVMKTCMETVYDEEERTFYRPVYKEEMQDRVINTMEFVEETRYRCCPCTIWQPQEDCCCPTCGAVATANACGCGASSALKMVPVQIIKKVPYTVVVSKPVQKTEKVPRTVVTMEPYTVTVCVPRTVCREIPVQVCCPPTCCCDDPCCEEPCGCGECQ